MTTDTSAASTLTRRFWKAPFLSLLKFLVAAFSSLLATILWVLAAVTVAFYPVPLLAPPSLFDWPTPFVIVYFIVTFAPIAVIPIAVMIYLGIKGQLAAATGVVVGAAPTIVVFLLVAVSFAFIFFACRGVVGCP